MKFKSYLLEYILFIGIEPITQSIFLSIFATSKTCNLLSFYCECSHKVVSLKCHTPSWKSVKKIDIPLYILLFLFYLTCHCEKGNLIYIAITILHCRLKYSAFYAPFLFLSLPLPLSTSLFLIFVTPISASLCKSLFISFTNTLPVFVFYLFFNLLFFLVFYCHKVFLFMAQ